MTGKRKRKFGKYIKRTGRFRRKKGLKRKAGKAKRIYGIRTLKPHRERYNNRSELKWVDMPQADINIPSLAEAQPVDRIVSQLVDPQIAAIAQGVDNDQRVGEKINTIAVEFTFDLLVRYNTVLNALYWNAPSARDFFRRVRIIMYETKTAQVTPAQVLDEFITNQRFNSKPNINYAKIMYDKSFTSNVWYTAPVEAGVLYPLANWQENHAMAPSRRITLKFRIPYKATLQFNGNNPQTKKNIFLAFFTDATAVWNTNANPKSQWQVLNFFWRLWYTDP